MYRILAKLEGLLVRQLRLNNRTPPLFIVGAPRSGTTLVYLHLFNRYQFAYFPNMAKRRPLAPVSYTVAGRLLLNQHRTYENRYGIVDGGMAPSDGWGIFHRWFPPDDAVGPVERLSELKTIVALLERVFSAPFLNKNNSNSLRISHFDSLFPDALFVWVRRDVAATVLSLLAARVQHRIPSDEWWGAPPPQFRDMSFESDVDRAVHQVVGLDLYIQEQLERVPEHRWLQLDYDAFCAAPDRAIDWVESSYSHAGVSLSSRPSERSANAFSARSRVDQTPAALVDEIRERAHSVLRRLD